MQIWTLNPPRAAAPGRVANANADVALAGLIACIGHRDFGSAALARLNEAVAAASWSAYHLPADAPPRLRTSGAFGIPDPTQDCFRAYRAGLYRRDESFASARERAAPDMPVLVHWRASEMPAQHRERIYLRHGMRERLSVVGIDAAGDLLAVNLYRHEHEAGFRDADIDTVHSLALALFACVRRHVEGFAEPAAAAGPAPVPEPPAPPPTLAIRALLARAPSLSERELQVCERLLRGWTHDGIAADLGVSATTVKTYRNRAFERLGIHFRNELFGLVLQSAVPAD